MSGQRRTPQTQEEFIDYRFNQTDESIEQMRKDIVNQFDKINTKLDDTYATKDYVNALVGALKEEIKTTNAQVSSLVDDRKWLIRSIVGIIVTGIMGILFVAGGK